MVGERGPVKESDIRMDFFEICMKYRVVSLVITVLTFLLFDFKVHDLQKWLVVFGLIISCTLGNFLYRKTRGMKSLPSVILSMELFAYGIFILFSGGFSSPFLWYYICCQMVTLVGDGLLYAMIPSILWCFICAIVGGKLRVLEHMEVNIIVGILVAMGSFGLLRYHAQLLEKQNNQLEVLNFDLRRENMRREYAIFQMAAIYQYFDFFASNDKSRVMERMARLLKRTIAEGGCVILKTDSEGDIEDYAFYGLDQALAENLVGRVISEKLRPSEKGKSVTLFEEGGAFDVFFLEDEVFLCGILIRRRVSIQPSLERFYLKLITVIFHNLNMNRQMAEYICCDEKNRIANEIHDTVIQKLFAIVCGLKELENYMDQWDEDQKQEKIKTLERASKQAMTELRETIYHNRFESETEGSLVRKIETYTQEFSQLNQVVLEVDAQKQVDMLSPTHKIIIYRMVCEAVHNAVKHGNATHIKVCIALEDTVVNVMVSDNGVGFVEKEKTHMGGMGLDNMKRMASFLMGKFWIDQRKDGVSLHLKLPRSI